VALMVMFLAASAQWRSTLQPELTKAAPQQQPMSRPSITPYIAVAVSYFLLIQAGRHVVFDPLGGLILGAVVITSLVSVRQLTALRDNRELAIGYRALADIDGLTGLYNRRRFMDLAEEVFAHAHRLDLPLAAMMIDIDHFKQINDQFGHMCGDQVISGIARFCQERLRPDDIAGRYGGDELIILLPGTSSEAAVHLAERLSERNGEVTKLGASAMPFTISIGIADVTGCRDTAALLARADLALYEAKRAGRACWRVYEEIDPSARAPVEAIVGVE
jgi:diguanylate cyclase